MVIEKCQEIQGSRTEDMNMEKYKLDENNGLWYELQGDYYLPCLKLPEEEQAYYRKLPSCFYQEAAIPYVQCFYW